MSNGCSGYTASGSVSGEILIKRKTINEEAYDNYFAGNDERMYSSGGGGIPQQAYRRFGGHYRQNAETGRRLIEPYAVRCATEKATEGNLDEIRDLDFEHRYVLRKGESGSEQDLRIHLKFAELSGNSALYQVLNLLLTENNVYQYFSSIIKNGEAGSYVDHDVIFKAVYAKDADAAAAAMEQHIENLIKLAKENMKNK